MLGIKGGFSNTTGSGAARYAYELYNNLLNFGELVYKKEYTDTGIRYLNGLSITLKALLNDYSGFDIICNLLPVIFINKMYFAKGYLVSNVHDFGSILYTEFETDIRRTFRDKLWNSIMINGALKSQLHSDYLTVDSEQTKKEAILLGYKNKNISVINLGIDKTYIEHPKHTYNKNIFIVGYLGAMRKRKNIKFGIQAFNFINNPKIQFHIWGLKAFDYEYLNHIKNFNIYFKGFAPEHKLINIYDSFDVFVFPSLYEGFGLPILEAQSRGLPVIIYKNGKIPKEVRKYCFEAESPEHMAQIIEDLKENGYNEKLRKKATEYARSFTWEKCAKETLEVYKKVLEK